MNGCNTRSKNEAIYKTTNSSTTVVKPHTHEEATGAARLDAKDRLSYTSDATDDLTRVALGGRRYIQPKHRY